MDKVSFIAVSNFGKESIQHAIIDHGDGNFTSMPKSVYDEQQAANEAKTF